MTEKSMILKEFFIKFSDLYNKMRECDHSLPGKLNPYHEEGSVWTHTEMVLNALPSTVSDSVVVAALLHDIGKVYTREVTPESRVRFFNHASRSTFEAIDILKVIYDNFSSFFNTFSVLNSDSFVHVLNLINLHYIFFNYSDSQTEKNAVKLAKKLYGYGLTFYNDLVDLVKADHVGRISSEKDTVSDDFMDLVRVKIEEFLKMPVPSRDETNNSILMLVGIPYSGKSYSINDAENIHDHIVVSRDNLITSKFPHLNYHDAWKVVDHDAINLELDHVYRTAVKEKKNIIIDMTNLSVKSRNKMLSQIPKGYFKQATVYYTGLNRIRDRVKEREDKKIDYSILERMMNSFQVPLFSEFDEINFYLQF